MYCVLTITYKGITVTRSAVGSFDSHQSVLDKKPGNKIKATQSNAFVRAARQFGVGEYENNLPAIALRRGPAKGTYLDNAGKLLPDAAAAGAYLAGQRRDELYLHALINCIRNEARAAAFPALSSVVMLLRQQTPAPQQQAPASTSTAYNVDAENKNEKSK